MFFVVPIFGVVIILVISVQYSIGGYNVYCHLKIQRITINYQTLAFFLKNTSKNYRSVVVLQCKVLECTQLHFSNLENKTVICISTGINVILNM